MQIPNSIDSLTTEKPATSLDFSKAQAFNTQRFFECIKDIIPLEYRKFFDKGYNFYKLSNSSDLAFLKTIFYLYIDFYKESLRHSNIDVEKQEVTIKSLDLIFKNVENSFEIFNNLLQQQKIDKKTFDINQIFMIIIGYAISNIQKSN